MFLQDKNARELGGYKRGNTPFCGLFVLFLSRAKSVSACTDKTMLSPAKDKKENTLHEIAMGFLS